MPRYSAIDIGTNSVKITTADVGANGEFAIVAESSKVTRLGRGVDKTRRFDEAAAEATLQAIREFSEAARQSGAERIVAGGTSAMRDAENGDEFRRRAAEITGGGIELITGDREAELTFLGAMSDVRVAGQGGGEILAFDVGGGSTELIAGESAPPKILKSQSLDIGAVRLTERFFTTDSPSREELTHARAAVGEFLDQFELPAAIPRIVGIGGTAVNAAAMLRAERTPDSQPSDAPDLQGEIVSAANIDHLIDSLAILTLDERKFTPGLDPSRADVIVAGLLIISQILHHFRQPSFTLSTRGVRHGLLLELSS